MFEFNPELKGEGDDGEDDEETVVIQRQDDDEVQRSHLYSYQQPEVISLSCHFLQDEASGGATAVDLTNFNEWATDLTHYQVDDDDDDDDDDDNEDEVVPKGAVGGSDTAVQIDEDLFIEDVPIDDELFDVDEEELIDEEQLLIAATINDLHLRRDNNSDSDPESVE